MGIYKKLPEEIGEVDVIVAGDPNLSVLVVEGGPDNYQDPSIVHIGLFFGHLMPDSKSTLFYPSKPSDHISGRAPVVPAGGVLGGGSSINMCMYSRPQRSDFDDWDVPGWSANDMLEFMKKLETYHGRGDKALHGIDGPIHISSGTHRALKAEDDFIEAAKKAGWPEVEDLQTMDAVNAVARALRYVSPEGTRQDTAHRYLHPLLQDGKHPNLHVVVESQVVKVTIDNGKATGVVFRPNPKFHPNDKTERTVKARKLVVVSCGAIGTPLVLERSGVGSPDVLSKAGVAVAVENRGVGASYFDHQLMGYAYKTSLEKGDTINGLLFGKDSPIDLIKSNDRTLGYNAQDASGKFRPTDEEAALLGPEFLEAWNAHFKNKPDKPLCAMALINAMPGVPPEGVSYGEYLGLTSFSLYPFSSGHVHITGPSIDDALDFDTGFLSDAKGIDIKKHVWAYKTQREIMRRLVCYRGEVPQWHPPFADDSTAAIVSTDDALPNDVENIVYSSADDAVLEEYIRSKADTTWHSMGSCKMALREKGGAVDANLNVYGVDGLKLADLSIAPGNVGANTNNTALAIGEKAADIFIRELGLAKA
ncbi:alcohol oxidase [Fusarium albosuccineum]|uniref:Alcohol oxidase n=1 Tax=Fusarium albosuccineum TaxID=1237068 RepID=A0A8H4PH07_9HYPO|nr:alcohol oxidase [Fusarium albosuccineum]